MSLVELAESCLAYLVVEEAVMALVKPRSKGIESAAVIVC